MPHIMGDFRISGRTMRYSSFVGRLYNLCRSYGFEAGKIMPSRAFCSDESQGYPIILIAKHFGTFPFNHGRVGGIVATGRHAPHAQHGKDLVLLQASHIGYDPETKSFGCYRRLQTQDRSLSTSCGKVCEVLMWYQQQYDFAKNNIEFSRIGGKEAVIVDNQLLNVDRSRGLFLHLSRLLSMENGEVPEPLRVFSTSTAFPASEMLKKSLSAAVFQEQRQEPIGERLSSEMFYFKAEGLSGELSQLEQNLSFLMPRVVTSPSPALSAAQVNTQVEFDRAYRTIITEKAYRGKNLLFVAGINIDISPSESLIFPLTKFVPWAAYLQTEKGHQSILEQDELWEALNSQSKENPDQINLENEISAMKGVPELKVELPKS